MSKTLQTLLTIELPISVSFGHQQIPLHEVLALQPESIVKLNSEIESPVNLIVNQCVVARGELVIIDQNYGVRITEILSLEDRLNTLN